MKDLYEILGVPSAASDEQIKAAYRKLARERHPDSDPGNPWAEDEFKELASAYGILSDPKTRTAYDHGEIDGNGAKRRTGRRRGPFDGWPERAARRAAAGRIKIDGGDVEYDLAVTMKEAIDGAVKYVSMTNGKRLKVTIPAGTADGAVLRLKGQGMPGLGGGGDGNARVQIKFLADPMFQREETDIHVELSVSLPEALLGSRIEAPTIDGPVTLIVPPNSNTGTILRLKEKGLPTGKTKGARGDQYVTLKVVLPKKPDQALTNFIAEWAQKNPYTVRSKPDSGKSD